MMRFLTRRRENRTEALPPPTSLSAAGAPDTATGALEIEELEPRLTPDYLGLFGGGSGGGSGGIGGAPGRTVGWGC